MHYEPYGKEYAKVAVVSIFSKYSWKCYETLISTELNQDFQIKKR